MSTSDGLISLTEEMIREASGVEELELLEEIEIIFTPFHEFNNLDKCSSLRILNVLKSPVRRLINLHPVSHSLERLCLHECNITKIEGLMLPKLKELLMHNNGITKLEGLNGCPKLQKLILTSNKISKIENLESLTELKEIYLQDNKIMRIENLEPLVNLEKLYLAGNRIEEYKDLISLSHLPALKELSFADYTFGLNGITLADGYRSFAICHLKSLVSLDGIGVNNSHRSQAEEHYMSKVLEFNDRIDAICRENERELVALEARRKRNTSIAKDMKDELLNTFQDLEKVVVMGRKKVDDEERRQIKIRETNMKSFQQSIQNLKNNHADDIAKMASKNSNQLASRIDNLSFLKNRVTSERDLAIFAANTTFDAQKKSIIHEVAPHTPDFRLISNHYTNAMGKVGANGACAVPLKVYKVFNKETSQNIMQATKSGLINFGEMQYLYIVAEASVLHDFITKGFKESDSNYFLLWPSPSAAFAHMINDNDTKIYEILVVRTVIGETDDLDNVRKVDGVDILKTLDETIQRNFSKNGKVGLVNVEGDIAYVFPRSKANIINPEYILLAMNNDKDKGLLNENQYMVPIEEAINEIIKTSQDVNNECESILRQYTSKLVEEVEKFEERVWREMDPESAKRLNDAEYEVQRLESSRDTLRQQIESEKNSQESILKDFRESMSKERSNSLSNKLMVIKGNYTNNARISNK